VEQRLVNSGLSVATLQTTPSFVQLKVTDKELAVVIDLISEPMDAIDTPETHPIGLSEILVDSPRSILAEKLCALLERSELRDLIDVDALMNSGESLDLAIADAPRRDSGFSPLTLAWVLRGFDVHRLAKTAGINATEATRLDAFRLELIDRFVNPKV
jgi:hypothetical protein